MLTYNSFKNKNKTNNDNNSYLTNYPQDLHRKSINQQHHQPVKVSINLFRNKKFIEKLIHKVIKLMFISMSNIVAKFLNLNLREVHQLLKRMFSLRRQVPRTNSASPTILAK